MTAATARSRWRATASSASSRSTLQKRASACASHPPCRRCWPAAMSTPASTAALACFMSFHAVVPAPAYDPVGRAQAAARDCAPDRGRRELQRTSLLNASYTRREEDNGLSADDWPTGYWRRCASPCVGAWSRTFPSACCCPGGVDSSLIVGLLAEEGQKDLMTFSIGFEEANGEKGDEFVYSDLIAERFGTDHHKIFVPSADLMTSLPDTIAAQSSRWSPTTISASSCSAARCPSTSRWCSRPGRRRSVRRLSLVSPLAGSNDVVADYARVFFDRSRETMAGTCRPSGWRTRTRRSIRRRSH